MLLATSVPVPAGVLVSLHKFGRGAGAGVNRGSAPHRLGSQSQSAGLLEPPHLSAGLVGSPFYGGSGEGPECLVTRVAAISVTFLSHMAREGRGPCL